MIREVQMYELKHQFLNQATEQLEATYKYVQQFTILYVLLMMPYQLTSILEKYNG